MTYRDSEYHVVRIDLRETKLRLFWKRPDGESFKTFRGLSEWLDAQGETLLFATNAGIYAKDRTPLGLHIEDGETLRRLNQSPASDRGNFSMKPNGVFFIDDSGARILTTEAYAADETLTPELAVQSGPLLVIDNELHPKFRAESESVYLRNGVGVKSAHDVVFVLSRRPVNLHTFASIFRDKLGCDNALYLDGNLSDMYLKGEALTRLNAEFVGMLGVTEKKE